MVNLGGIRRMGSRVKVKGESFKDWGSVMWLGGSGFGWNLFFILMG